MNLLASLSDGLRKQDVRMAIKLERQEPSRLVDEGISANSGRKHAGASI